MGVTTKFAEHSSVAPDDKTLVGRNRQNPLARHPPLASVLG